MWIQFHYTNECIFAKSFRIKHLTDGRKDNSDLCEFIVNEKVVLTGEYLELNCNVEKIAGAIKKGEKIVTIY